MPKTKRKKENWWLWFTIGLCSYLLIAPNMTIMRVLVAHIQPIEFTFLRSLLITIIAVPIILSSIRKFNKRNLTFTLGAGLCMLVATISLTYAVKYSSASYTAVMSLLSPIMLIILSNRLMGDKMTFRAIAGVSLAAAGALLVVAAPFILTGNTSHHFYPLATTLMIFGSFFFTLGIIFSRKSNEAGMPLSVNSGLMTIVILIGSFLAMYAVEGLPTDVVHFSLTTWLGIFYSGVIVVFVARIMNIASYEHTGAAVNGGLNYLGTIVAIAIPLVLLGERLPSTVVIGGVIILAGVYLTERRRAKHQHHKYMHAH